jgi:hypothetical protein
MASLPPASNTPTASLDFGRCFTFVTEDPEWVKKVLIGGLFALASMFIVGAFFLAGYLSRFIRRVAAGDALPLPDWDDLGGLFGEGARIVGLYLVYLFGVTLVVAALSCPLMLAAGGLSGITGGSEGAERATAVLGGLGILFFYAGIFVVSVAMMVFMPAALTRVVFKESLGAGLEIRPIVGFIRQNLGNYLLTLVVFILANFASQFGFLLCCVGLFPAAFWSYLALGHGLGQTVRANPASLG